MESQLKKSISFSNAGAKHVQRGDHKAAIKALSVAFYSFKKSYNHIKRLVPDECRNRKRYNFNMDEWMRKLNTGESDDFLIYKHPIIIPVILDTTLESCGLVSTAITFNLALANHLSSIETNNPKYAQTAARLYEYGFNLERIRGKQFVSPFFLVAVLNNLGHLHKSIHDVERSNKCFSQLLSTLLYLTQIKGANPKDLEAFFGNTTVGLSQISRKCAGAA